MKKLTAWLKKVDDNLLFISVCVFTLATALVPKIPLFHIDYTYIKGRYDDFFIIPVFLIYIIQIVRRKNKFRFKFGLPILLFWAAIAASVYIGINVQATIPVHFQGILHGLRRVQYMLIYFVALSAIDSEKRFMKFLKIYVAGVFVVALYGFGQKFLSFPSIQSMNPAYVDGRLLFLTPFDRINSTFGGHFDLAAYLVFSMPILFGLYFYTKERKYIAIFAVSLMTMLYTAARSSFGAYLMSISMMMLYARKFLVYLFVIVLTVILMLVTGDMTKRFLQTVQVKTVFVNTQTGGTTIDQKLSTEELAAGNLTFKLPGSDSKRVKADQEKIRQTALDQAREEAARRGNSSQAQIEKRAAEIAKNIIPQQMILCDISCSTRLQVEWPRALGHFFFSPIIGTGPSSLGEATDNSFLRWLGELGIVGAGIFAYLLIAMTRFVWRAGKSIEGDKRYVYLAYAFSMVSLAVNAVYIDAFEASKVAYNLWLVSGAYVAAAGLILEKKS